jgi:hypothetical protein
MAAMFPLSALMVSRLSEALEIAAPHPVAVIMPNDARLGQFRAVFAGRVGMVTVHEDERKSGGPGFGGYT